MLWDRCNDCCVLRCSPCLQALAKLLKRSSGGGDDDYDDLEGQA